MCRPLRNWESGVSCRILPQSCRGNWRQLDSPRSRSDLGRRKSVKTDPRGQKTAADDQKKDSSWQSLIFLRVVVAIEFFLKVGQSLRTLAATQTRIQLLQGHRNHMIVMQMAVVRIARQAEPDVVHQLEVLGTETRSVRAKNVLPLATVGSDHIHTQPRFRVWQMLPRSEE